MAESKKTKAELRETAEALCREYNDNIQNGNFQETTRLNDEIEQKVYLLHLEIPAIQKTLSKIIRVMLY